MGGTGADDDRVGSDIAAQATTTAIIALIALAVPALILFLHLHPPFLGWVLVLAYTFLVLRYAAHQWRNIASRRYGRSTEAAAIRAATKTLPAYGLQIEAADKQMPGLGDIDMLVAGARGRAAVEIKSFHAWDPHADRCRHAISQACREAAASHAEQATVWLPGAVAGPRAAYYHTDGGRDVLVVAGSAKALAIALHGTIA